ncbi:MAG: hypothetical protein WBP44_09290 [Gammaproteobacteria bacterium]|jgi:hypothetical protein
MAKHALTSTTHRGLSTEKFFYFFMGLRKGEIRKQVQMMKERFPEDDPQRPRRQSCASEAGAVGRVASLSLPAVDLQP